MTTYELIELLKSKTRQAENAAEDYIQEYDNQQECDRHLSKAEAFQEIIDILTTDQVSNGLGF